MVNEFYFRRKSDSMISKNKQKLIAGLARKKTREKEGLFLVEGDKMIKELFTTPVKIKTLIATPDFLSGQHLPATIEIIEASQDEIRKVSLLQNAQKAIAICEIPQQKFNWEKSKNDLILALDTIQDPGNLGTIIRLADWFGIKEVVCSPGTVDVYNPKTIQATMGAVFRVNVTYRHLPSFLEEAIKHDLPVFGAFLEGEEIYQMELSGKGIIVLGNEGQGISPEVASKITQKIFIPSYPKGIPTSESLNVSMAASIICSEFRRRQF